MCSVRISGAIFFASTSCQIPCAMQYTVVKRTSSLPLFTRRSQRRISSLNWAARKFWCGLFFGTALRINRFDAKLRKPEQAATILRAAWRGAKPCRGGGHCRLQTPNRFGGNTREYKLPQVRCRGAVWKRPPVLGGRASRPGTAKKREAPLGDGLGGST